MFTNYLYTSSTSKVFRSHFVEAAKKYYKELKLNKKKSYIIDIGSNDGVALKPFLDLGFKKVLGIEPAKNLAKLANKNKVKTFNGFLEKKNIKKIKKNADLILASNVFAHSDKLKEMTECMISLLSKKGTIIIEIQYLMNTLKDLTFDNIYHEHYNYWSLTSLVYFFNKFNAKIYKSEIVDTHGGSIRVYIKKDKKVKIEKSVNKMLKDEEDFGIKNFKTYREFGEKVYKIRENVLNNIKKLKDQNNIVIGYGAPAKATTALNFFGISKEINFIVEDNKLKHNKFIPGVKIPIKKKTEVKNNLPLYSNSLLDSCITWRFINFSLDILKNMFLNWLAPNDEKLKSLKITLKSMMINTEKAYNLIKKNISCIKRTNKVNIKKSIGLYLAEDIKSNINIPPQDNSAVDGFAINFSNHKKNLNKVYDIVYEINAGDIFRKKKLNLNSV